jgi:hypothetical protein
MNNPEMGQVPLPAAKQAPRRRRALLGTGLAAAAVAASLLAAVVDNIRDAADRAH